MWFGGFESWLTPVGHLPQGTGLKGGLWNYDVMRKQRRRQMRRLEHRRSGQVTESDPRKCLFFPPTLLIETQEAKQMHTASNKTTCCMHIFIFAFVCSPVGLRFIAFGGGNCGNVLRALSPARCHVPCFFLFSPPCWTLVASCLLGLCHFRMSQIGLFPSRKATRSGNLLVYLYCLDVNFPTPLCA